MTFYFTLGWWIAPALFTVALLVGWRLFGVRMDKAYGPLPDCAGALFELLGYVVAALLAAIGWLVWALLH